MGTPKWLRRNRAHPIESGDYSVGGTRRIAPPTASNAPPSLARLSHSR